MLNWKRALCLIFTGLCLLAITACSQNKTEAANQIRVGTIAGPETELMEIAKQVAAQKYNLNIKIVQFEDYTMPNEALADGSIDANAFQHLPYLQAAMKAKGYKLTVAGKTFIYPMGIYSKRITNLAQLRDGATVAIPNDPSNEARALLLLQSAKLITLKPNTDISATITDIQRNPKHLVIKEIDAAQLPRVLPDVDLATINTNYAMVANLLPTRDALFIENPDSPYANLIVVRAGDENKPQFQKLVAAIHSPEVLQKAQKLFQGQAIPAWDTKDSASKQAAA
ncbi:MAG: MetQ/NlpA family ABC transporter substrate-binding protein [Gammaproteobacteria bacterium]